LEHFVYGRRDQTDHFNGFSNELANFISRHFFDPLIANPDLKETYLTRLNIMLQYSKYMQIFEKIPFCQDNFVCNLMQAFDRRNIYPVCKNFLRFAKGQGFRDII